jgi:hypothetical protein
MKLLNNIHRRVTGMLEKGYSPEDIIETLGDHHSYKTSPKGMDTVDLSLDGNTIIIDYSRFDDGFEVKIEITKDA